MMMLPPGAVRYRIIASPAEGIAAEHTPYTQGKTRKDPPFHDGFDAVSGTGGRKPAGALSFQGGQKSAVQLHRHKNEATKAPVESFCRPDGAVPYFFCLVHNAAPVAVSVAVPAVTFSPAPGMTCGSAEGVVSAAFGTSFGGSISNRERQ